jgi:hypothetical protein
MRNSGSNLHGFLPPHAFVMGKAPVPAPDGALCVFCGNRSHVALCQGSDSPFLILTGPAPEDSPERALLLKILEAMKLEPARVRLWSLDSAISSLSSGCTEALLEECLRERPGVLIAFGPLAPRGGVIRKGDWHILVTEGLTEMSLQPELKKIAWEELKSALQAARKGAES